MNFKLSALLLFCGLVVNAQTVVVSNDPTNPVNVTCVSGCSGSAAAVVLTTVTFNGAPQPVSGTFWPTTQPVSGNVSVVQSTVGIVGSISNTGFNVNNTVPVTGTFWPATQPVSVSNSTMGVVAVGNFPVTGTFFQATQPVTSTYTTVVSTGLPVFNSPGTQITVVSTGIPITGSISNTGFNVNNVPSVNFNAIGQPVTSTFTIVLQSTVGVVNGGTQFNAVVTGSTVGVVPMALTKGTQGATGVTTQDLKDSGRTFVVFVATGVAGVTAEALMVLTQNKGGTRTEGVTSYVITTGKTMRLQGLYCSNRDGTTAVSWTRAVLRTNFTGATTATSPMIFATEIGNQAALAGSGSNFAAPFPDGVEIAGDGTKTIGISHLDQATTNLVSCSLIGYEY